VGGGLPTCALRQSGARCGPDRPPLLAKSKICYASGAGRSPGNALHAASDAAALALIARWDPACGSYELQSRPLRFVLRRAQEQGHAAILVRMAPSQVRRRCFACLAGDRDPDLPDHVTDVDADRSRSTGCASSLASCLRSLRPRCSLPLFRPNPRVIDPLQLVITGRQQEQTTSVSAAETHGRAAQLITIIRQDLNLTKSGVSGANVAAITGTIFARVASASCFRRVLAIFIAGHVSALDLRVRAAQHPCLYARQNAMC